MTEKRLNLTIKGVATPMVIRYRLRSWRNTLVIKQLNIENPIWLIGYSRKDNTATADTNAPTWYIDLAVLHEMICCGNCYTDAINRLTDFNIADDQHRCAETERFILSIAGQHRAAYIKARIQMFELILDKRLNRAKEEQIRETLAMLRAEADTNNDADATNATASTNANASTANNATQHA